MVFFSCKVNTLLNPTQLFNLTTIGLVLFGVFFFLGTDLVSFGFLVGFFFLNSLFMKDSFFLTGIHVILPIKYYYILYYLVNSFIKLFLASQDYESCISGIGIVPPS